LLEPSNLRYQP